MGPVLHHLLLPGPRSLCELEPVVDADAEPPTAVCASCLLLLARIRREAAALVQIEPTAIPERPSEAWAALKDTAWAQHLDLDEFLKRPDLDDSIDLFAFTLAVDPKSVAALIESWKERAAPAVAHQVAVSIGATTKASCSGCSWMMESDDGDAVIANARAHAERST